MQSTFRGAKKTAYVLLAGSLVLVFTVGYSAFGTYGYDSADLDSVTFVGVEYGAGTITLDKLGISVTGVTNKLSATKVTDYDSYSYLTSTEVGEDSSSQEVFLTTTDDDENEIILTSGDTETGTTVNTLVNGKVCIELTVNLDSAWESDSAEEDDPVPNIANLDYDNTAYRYLKVELYATNSLINDVTAKIYPTNKSSNYGTMTSEAGANTSTTIFRFPLKLSTGTSVYSLANSDSSYPVRDTDGNITDYKVPVTMEFDMSGVSAIAGIAASTLTYTLTASVEGAS